MKLCIEHLSKKYGELQVLQDLSLTLEQDACYCLMSPSGSGKTTLLRILMGLETADSGRIFTQDGPGWPLRISAVFQEDRLCLSFSPMENVQMALKEKWKEEKLAQAMTCLLPKECLTRPVSTLSGGMKRRCALLRALLAPCDMFIFDEPFTGLDEKTKDRVIRYLLEKTDGRPVLMSTHDRNDAGALGAKILEFN